MSNKLSDLNAHLFAQLDRLAQVGLTPEELEAECKRSDAITGIADQIARTADLQLRAAKIFAEHGAAVLPLLPQIGKADTPKAG